MRIKTKRAIRRGLKAGGYYDTRGLYNYVHEKTGLNDKRRGIKRKKEVDPIVVRIYLCILIVLVIILVVVFSFIKINDIKRRNGFNIKNIELYKINNNYYVKGIVKNNSNNECKSGNVFIYAKEKTKKEFIIVYLDKFPEKNNSLNFDSRISKPKNSFNKPNYSLYEVECH